MVESLKVKRPMIIGGTITARRYRCRSPCICPSPFVPQLLSFPQLEEIHVPENDGDDDEELDEREGANAVRRILHGMISANVERSTPNFQRSTPKVFASGRSTSNTRLLHYSIAPCLDPLPHLLWERALRAIGIVLQTKVFVNLEQPLLVRHRFQKLPAARIVPEKACGSGLKPSIRQTC
jgi:hypothetical protein